MFPLITERLVAAFSDPLLCLTGLFLETEERVNKLKQLVVCRWKQLSKWLLNENKEIPPSKQHPGIIKQQTQVHVDSHTRIKNAKYFLWRNTNNQTFMRIQWDTHFHIISRCSKKGLSRVSWHHEKMGTCSHDNVCFCSKETKWR